MTTDTQLPDRLAQLGEALERAARGDLAHSRTRRRLRHPRRAAAGVALAAIVVPAAAIAATQLISTAQVAASLPQGTKALIGTDPTCTVVTANVEYHCVLATAPSNDGAPQSGSGNGPTVFFKKAPGTTVVVKLKDGKSLIVKARSEPALKQNVAGLLKQHDAGSTTTSLPAPSTTDWTGTVEPTVDASKHVNGGCRAQNAAGTDWECYIGQAAVQQKIISQGFLGQYAPAPGVG